MSQCSHDPRELAGQPIGMLHCPECGEMVVAGLEHPDYEPTTCECGYWSCGGGRGCGDCPDCSGEHCECGLEFPHGEFPNPRTWHEAAPLPYDSPFTGHYGELMDEDLLDYKERCQDYYDYLDPDPGLLPTGERVADMD